MAQHIKKSSTDWLDKHGLNDMQRTFVLNYLTAQNATAAAAKAGYKHPESQGSRLSKIVKVRAAIKDGRSQIEERQMIDAEGVARLWLDLATADPTELTQNVHAPCRYCYGIDGEYQWRTSVSSALPILGQYRTCTLAVPI